MDSPPLRAGPSAVVVGEMGRRVETASPVAYYTRRPSEFSRRLEAVTTSAIAIV